MPMQNTNRRLSGTLIQQDITAYNGLSFIKNYTTPRTQASPEVLEQTYQAMLAAQQVETEQQAAYRAAVDAARQAEWDFHNAVLAMKEVVRGTYGSDSDEAQAVGLKKKSERRRARRGASTTA
ncbi:MAG: hypothetical protein ACFB4J_01340 [Elainellaceae cyanobacterium]